jgi:hypothetical protein
VTRYTGVYTGHLSAEHALICGYVWGIALDHGVDLRPILDDDGNYTEAFELRSSKLPPGVTITIHVSPPEAPADD